MITMFVSCHFFLFLCSSVALLPFATHSRLELFGPGSVRKYCQLPVCCRSNKLHAKMEHFVSIYVCVYVCVSSIFWCFSFEIKSASFDSSYHLNIYVTIGSGTAVDAVALGVTVDVDVAIAAVVCSLNFSWFVFIWNWRHELNQLKVMAASYEQPCNLIRIHRSNSIWNISKSVRTSHIHTHTLAHSHTTDKISVWNEH